MPLAVWEQVRDKFLPQVNGIEAAGLGEPLLAKLFPQVARETLAAGKTFYFPTNGHYLDTKLTDCLGDGTNVRVSISFDAGDPEGYVSIGRGKVGEWEKTWDAIDAFRIKCPNAFLHSQYTASKVNIAAMPEFVRKAAEHGITEIIMRFVQNHAEAREDMSLRFAKVETEAAITEASEIASAAGIMFIAERRPYAEEVQFVQEETGFDAMSASEASLARYLSFVPMNAASCPDGCVTIVSTSTVSLTQGVATTSSLHCVYLDGTCDFTYQTYAFTDASAANEGGDRRTSCVRSTVIGTTVVTCTTAIITGSNNMILSSSGTQTYTTIHFTTTLLPLFSTDVMCLTNSYPCPIATTRANGGIAGTSITNFVCNGSCTTLIGTYYDLSGAFQSTQKSAVPPSCPQPMSESGPEIVRSVKVPRTQLSPQSVLPVKEIPIVLTDASVIAWEDGTLSTCFARHPVGSVFTDTWESLIKNARYQAFLHNRTMGDVNNEAWCRDCPRVM